MSYTRENFENNLNLIFDMVVFDDLNHILEALITNDKILSYDILTKYLRAKGRIAFYLNEWDNAPTESAKNAVIVSVIDDLGNEIVDPQSAIKKGSEGIFGLITAGGSTLQTFSASIDTTTIGNTPLLSVPSGTRFVPIKATYTLIGVGGLTTPATLSIGSNVSNYNNISGATLLTGLTALGGNLSLDLSSPASVLGASDVYARVSIGSLASQYQVIASVTGFFV